MSTAAAFRSAASRLDELAEESRALDASSSIADVYAELALVARQRADTCDLYDAAMRSFRAAHHEWSERQVEWRHALMDPDRPRAEWPGTEPTPPDPPSFG